MEWQDEGVVLAMRPHGESAAILDVFTAAHGRHSGVLRGGAGRRMAPLVQPGAHLALVWRARLEDHLGTFTVEPLRARATVLGDPLALAGLSAVCAMLRVALPERAPQDGLWGVSVALLDAIEAGDVDWPLAYLRWEMRLLEDLGFGLDLTRCAVTGTRDDLAWVSPRTGRAVSRDAAGDWAPRLLPLPPCLLGQGPASPADLAQGLAITGHFLGRELAVTWAPDRGAATAPAPDRPPLPEARARLLTLLARAAGRADGQAR